VTEIMNGTQHAYLLNFRSNMPVVYEVAVWFGSVCSVWKKYVVRFGSVRFGSVRFGSANSSVDH
jgi:hypothetical protein